MAKHKGEKHTDYEWEDISWKAELAANKKASSASKNSARDYVTRCKELAEEAFGDFSKIPFSSMDNKFNHSIESYISDAIIKLQDEEVLADMINGYNPKRFK